MYNVSAMKTVVKTQKIGGSLMVRIPKDIVNEKSLKEGAFVEIEISRPRKDFFGVLKGIGKFTKEYELDTHE